MKTILFILIRKCPQNSRPQTPINGAIVRFYNPDNKDPNIDFIPDFTDALYSEPLNPGLYELIKCEDGTCGVTEVVRRLTKREQKWVQKYLDFPGDDKVTVEMCTFESEGHNGKRDFRLHDESATLISAFDLHDREGPIPKESGLCAMLFIPRGDKVFRRFEKPVDLKNIFAKKQISEDPVLVTI